MRKRRRRLVECVKPLNLGITPVAEGPMECLMFRRTVSFGPPLRSLLLNSLYQGFAGETGPHRQLRDHDRRRRSRQGVRARSVASRHCELLDAVRREGDWETWIAFLCRGVAAVSESAVTTARRLLGLAERDGERLDGLGRKAGWAAAVQRGLLRTPLSTIPRLAKRTRLTLPTVRQGFGRAAGSPGRERDHGQEAQSRVSLRPLPRHPERGDGAAVSAAGGRG